MSKRRRPGEVFATDLPCIRDWIALDETDRRVAETRTWDAKQWAREYFGPLQDAEIVVATQMLHYYDRAHASIRRNASHQLADYLRSEQPRA